MSVRQATESPVHAGPLSDEELERIDAYWRAANFLSVGQIYLLDNPLLREPLRPEHVKPRLLGHCLSVAWSTREAARQLGRRIEDLGLIVAHLGSGCSVTAVWQGRSVDTSMGETPLEGLMMGTRSGSVDPGMLIRLLVEGRLDLAQMDEALEHQSGLLGVSGVSGEMERVQAAADAGDKHARLAIAMFVRRAAAGIGAATTSLPHVDALVFTGGIGEHAEGVREQIVARLGALGIHESPVLVIEAREDLVIAAEAARLLS